MKNLSIFEPQIENHYAYKKHVARKTVLNIGNIGALKLLCALTRVAKYQQDRYYHNTIIDMS